MQHTMSVQTSPFPCNNGIVRGAAAGASNYHWRSSAVKFCVQAVYFSMLPLYGAYGEIKLYSLLSKCPPRTDCCRIRFSWFWVWCWNLRGPRTTFTAERGQSWWQFEYHCEHDLERSSVKGTGNLLLLPSLAGDRKQYWFNGFLSNWRLQDTESTTFWDRSNRHPDPNPGNLMSNLGSLLVILAWAEVCALCVLWLICCNEIIFMYFWTGTDFTEFSVVLNGDN